MEPTQGIEPWFSDYETDVMPLYETGVETPVGFQPTFTGLQPVALSAWLRSQIGGLPGIRTPHHLFKRQGYSRRQFAVRCLIVSPKIWLPTKDSNLD
jgi:hypothetical protein